MIAKISENVWKIIADSNAYFLDFEEKILIDTGNRSNFEEFRQFLSRLTDPLKIQRVIFTHMHYDHTGNFDIMRNARFFASKEAIADLNNNPTGTVLNNELAEMLKKTKIEPVTNMCGLEIIPTPGHTKGSICLWYEKEKILFSGDTLFKGTVGRTDLPTSIPLEMERSLLRLKMYSYRILCPGHDY